ncbi:uncharacterized protein [Euwallacea similis]|uniref:uncharacterized protein n=1 Tax=Euwallacea similis TaxID=1736056 RepID=UPI00344FCE7F
MKMFFSRDREKFIKVVGVLITIQGLTWFALSLGGILVKNAPPEKLTETDFRDYTKYSEYLSKIIYQNFLNSDVTVRSETKVIRPLDFEVFLWIYVVLSTVWVATSVDLHFAIKNRKPRQTYNTLTVGVIVLLTSIIDLVFFALLARDFSTCPFNLRTSSTETTSTSTTLSSVESASTAFTSTTALTSTTTLSSTTAIVAEDPIVHLYSSSDGNVATLIDCQVASGIVMTLAARGYVLWLVNVVLAINLLFIGAKALRTSKFLSYDRNTIPRVKIGDSSQRKAPSPSNDFHNGNGRYSPPGGKKEGRNYIGTPVALNSKNHSIYF